MMEDSRKERYFQKLIHFDNYYSLLNQWIIQKGQNLKEISENPQKLFSIYHGFQLIMEVIADIAAMIIKDIDQTSRDDYSNYQRLYEKQILDRAELQELNSLNGLRNRVVHDYNGIVDEIALAGIVDSLQFLLEIKGRFKIWLDQQ